MEGYSNSRGALLPRGRATPLSLLIMSALALAACGGGGGGGGGSGGSGGGGGGGTTNSPPTADAGADKTGNFPEAVSLDGTGTDPENAALTYAWTATPTAPATGTATFTAANAADTNVTFSDPGTYTVTLSVSDGTNAAVTDSATVTVTPTYPTATWTTAIPADVGLTAAKLDEARDYSTTTNPTQTTPADVGGSGIVIRYGKLVYSWGDPVNIRYDLKSTTKSIGGLALFLALAENKVTLDTFAQSVLGTQFAADPSDNQTNHPDYVSAISVKQLATHTAGFEKADATRVDVNLDGIDDAPNNGLLLAAPDAEWRYSDAGLNWLADVLTFVNNEDLSTVVKTKIFDPVGIATGGAAGLVWRVNLSRTTTLDVNGTSVPRRELASGISSNVDAMARIGYLMLRKGVWNGTQVIPGAQVALAHQPQTTAPLANQNGVFADANSNYGLLWWTNASGAIAGLPTDAYWSWGLGESLIVVIPSLDLVIARAGAQPANTGTTNREWNDGWDGDYAVLAPFLRPFAEAAAP